MQIDPQLTSYTKMAKIVKVLKDNKLNLIILLAFFIGCLLFCT